MITSGWRSGEVLFQVHDGADSKSRQGIVNIFRIKAPGSVTISLEIVTRLCSSTLIPHPPSSNSNRRERFCPVKKRRHRKTNLTPTWPGKLTQIPDLVLMSSSTSVDNLYI